MLLRLAITWKFLTVLPSPHFLLYSAEYIFHSLNISYCRIQRLYSELLNILSNFKDFQHFLGLECFNCWCKNLSWHVYFRENANIWLNGEDLKSIQTPGKVSSLTVSPEVDNTLTLQYGGSVQTWTLTIMPGELPFFRFLYFTKPRSNDQNN